MPMWCPPTPPQEQADVYIDQAMSHLYDDTPLPDSQLPPIYAKKELKRARAPEIPANLDGRRSMKVSRREDSPLSAPRSLFDHPSSALQKMRRDVKMHKYRGLVRPSGAATPPGAPRPVTPVATRDENAPEWSVHEDWALLQAIEKLQELPLTLLILKPGHTPNWDLVADMVNQVSCATRSPSQCRTRYEGVIIPREEGKLVLEQKKQKKLKSGAVYKMAQQKGNRALRTCQLNVQDNNLSFTEIYHQRFDTIKSLSQSRKPAPKPLLVNPLMKNPKHAAVLSESGIIYETPVNPIEIACRRADRIAKDKKLQVAQVAQATQSAHAAQSVQATHSLTTEQLTAQRQLVVATKAAQASTQALAAPSVNISVTLGNAVVGSSQVLQTVSTTAGTSATPPQSQSIVVASGTPLNSVMQTAGMTTLSPGLRQARPVATLPAGVGIQEMVVQASQARTATNTTAVVSVANLTPAQLQARIATGSLVSLPAAGVKAAGTTVPGVQVATGQKTLSSTQVNYYRQHAIMRQQTQRITMRDQQQVKVVQGQAKVAQVVQPASATQPKTQYLKQTTTGVAKGRQEDMAALMKQQLQRQQQQKSGAQQQTLTTQFITQAGIQVQGTQVATIVKSTTASTPHSVTIPLSGITIPQQLKTTVASTQQFRQLGLAANYQQLLNKPGRVQTKVTQLAKPSGVPTQLIVQSQAGKGMPAISMQHIQQVIKNVQPQHMTVTGSQAVAGGSQVVLAKSAASASSLGPRVLPGTQAPRQTIQVVPGTIRTVASVSQVSANSSLASALAGSIKVGQSGSGSQQAFISQVASLPGIVRQSGVNPVRIQTATSASGTPLMAVTVQQQAGVQQPSPDHTQGQS